MTTPQYPIAKSSVFMCCTMIELAGITYGTKKDIAKVMVNYTEAFTNTFLAAVPVSSSRCKDLEELGFRCVETIPGPWKVGLHGKDMKLYIFCLVEHGLMGRDKLKERFKEYLV